ncbi:hypothetical protein BWZ20_04230 [Winogradskyella sp. J14-2]|uniref:sulfotransferase domain-containing protein n=1 Tax=Winogradskyella sp. J14-2 TaxID=1936080 RepID=UPI000972E76C|nr:sulfotransferase domain-containing protein [Winogradskyella sp. J14-2]APY07551.1 hypothetical protein BWZ20_04230 [Winogradskyella sp. J14-2]
MNSIAKKVKRVLLKEKPLVKVYSHPRSGTHFLEAFLAKNFYNNKDLNLKEVVWGHWSNRKNKKDGNPYGKLFGNHLFAYHNKNKLPKIYIYRDGRAVAYSVWKTPNFLNKEDSKLDFNEFLQKPIDWYGTPSIKSSKSLTIFEHWLVHINSWFDLAEADNNLLLVKYEDLIDNPCKVYTEIHRKFFKKEKLLLPEELCLIEKPLGLLPNSGTKDAWKKFLNYENQLKFNTLIKSSKIKHNYH